MGGSMSAEEFSRIPVVPATINGVHGSLKADQTTTLNVRGSAVFDATGKQVFTIDDSDKSLFSHKIYLWDNQNNILATGQVCAFSTGVKYKVYPGEAKSNSLFSAKVTKNFLSSSHHCQVKHNNGTYELKLRGDWHKRQVLIILNDNIVAKIRRASNGYLVDIASGVDKGLILYVCSVADNKTKIMKKGRGLMKKLSFDGDFLDDLS